MRNRYRAFRWGLHYRHPLCCVLRYCASLHRNQACRRGGKETDRAGPFVPCGIFHRYDPDKPPAPNEFWPARARHGWGFGPEAPFTQAAAMGRQERAEAEQRRAARARRKAA